MAQTRCVSMASVSPPARGMVSSSVKVRKNLPPHQKRQQKATVGKQGNQGKSRPDRSHRGISQANQTKAANLRCRENPSQQ